MISPAMQRVSEKSWEVLRELYEQLTDFQQVACLRYFGEPENVTDKEFETAVLLCERTIKKNQA